jgi:hypothetical protein
MLKMLSPTNHMRPANGGAFILPSEPTVPILLQLTILETKRGRPLAWGPLPNGPVVGTPVPFRLPSA